MLICALSSCLASTAKERKTVMTVGEYDVPYEVYYYVTENLKSDLPDAADSEIEAEAFEMIKEIYAVFSLAHDFGVDPDDKYISSIVDDAVSAAIEECGSKGKYKDAISESNMNDSVFRLLKKHSQTADEILAALINSGKYPKDEEGIARLVKGDEFVCIKQVLVMSENSVNTFEDTLFTPAETHTDEEALAIAEKVRDKALAGEDFDALVKEYGESLYMFNNTDGYYVCRGMWDKVNESAVFALEVGDISEVIKSESGYSVFLRCEKSDDYISKNTDALAEDYYKAQYNLLLEKEISELEIETTEAYESIKTGK